MAKKFQDLTIDYTKLLGKMTIGDRISMLNSDEGRRLLSNLTPYQLAEMFPDYYKKQYPDVGKILKSISDPNFKGRAYSEEESATFMGIDRRRIGEGERISYEKTEITPSWKRKYQKEINSSQPGAKAELSNEKKQLLEEMSKGNISADDPRVAFLKDLSEADLKKAGIKKQTDENGNVISYGLAQTAAAVMTDNEISDKLRSESAIGFSPREQATLDFISRREGSNNPNIIFGDKGGVPGSGIYSKKLGLDKRPLEDRSVAEVLDLQLELTRLSRADGWGGGKGTSAVGTGQMVRSTLLANLRALGIPQEDWPNIKFDKNLQQRLTLQNFKTNGIGDPNADPSTWNMARLGAQYESVDVTKGFKGMTDAEKQKIAQASPIKPEPGDITQESIAAKRKELIQQDRQQQQSFLAQKLAENAGTQASATPNAAPKGALLAAGTNDWADEEKAYQGIVKSASALKGSGRDVVLVAPARLVNGQPHAYNAAQRAARDLGVKLVEPEEFGTGNDHYHISPNAAKKIKEQYSNYDVYGDSNAVRLGAKEGQTARTGAGAAEISNIITSQTEQSPAQPVTVNADGGKENINTDEIKAMPIKSLKGDNSVVVDKSNNPLFTMNTKEEQAVYNPKTRQVDVQPLSKTDPNQLGEKQTAPTPDATEDLSRPEITPQQIQQPQVPSSSPRSGDVSVNITDELFKDPSFRRAIAKTRFVDTGDAALGGHFGMANADLG